MFLTEETIPANRFYCTLLEHVKNQFLSVPIKTECVLFVDSRWKHGITFIWNGDLVEWREWTKQERNTITIAYKMQWDHSMCGCLSIGRFTSDSTLSLAIRNAWDCSTTIRKKVQPDEFVSLEKSRRLFSLSNARKLKEKKKKTHWRRRRSEPRTRQLSKLVSCCCRCYCRVFISEFHFLWIHLIFSLKRGPSI